MSDGQLGCKGSILESHYGSPQWSFWAPPKKRISGASYIHCAGTDQEGGWKRILGGFCATLSSRRWGEMKRDAGEEKGGWGYVDIIEFRGINYTDGKRGDMIYRDEKGSMLDLNMFR